MKQETAIFANQAINPPLTLVLIGGLALHERLTAKDVTARALRMGLSIDSAARAILELVNRGLASVSREGSNGQVMATPALADLAQEYRVRCILAYLGNVKTPARGKDYA